MRRDEPITWPLGTVRNPDHDRDASLLWLRFCIGDENDPDEVIEIRAHGQYRIDGALRDEIRSLPLESAADLSPSDIEMRETQLHPQGVGEPYLIDVWVLLQGLPANVVGSAIWDGCKHSCAGSVARCPQQSSARPKPTLTKPTCTHRHRSSN